MCRRGTGRHRSRPWFRLGFRNQTAPQSFPVHPKGGTGPHLPHRDHSHRSRMSSIRHPSIHRVLCRDPVPCPPSSPAAGGWGWKRGAMEGRTTKTRFTCRRRGLGDERDTPPSKQRIETDLVEGYEAKGSIVRTQGHCQYQRGRAKEGHSPWKREDGAPTRPAAELPVRRGQAERRIS